MPADEFVSALVKMQADLPVVPKNAENPHFKSKFADLASIVQATRPVLTEHGFAVTQSPGYNDTGTPTLTTVLWHAFSGRSISSEMLLYVAKNDPQSQGSALTYARRYAYSALLGLVTEEDDDGNAASEAPKAAEAPVTRPSPRQTQTHAGGTRKAPGPVSEPIPVAEATARVVAAFGDEIEGLADQLSDQLDTAF